jgi:hypothetical protein
MQKNYSFFGYQFIIFIEFDVKQDFRPPYTKSLIHSIHRVTGLLLTPPDAPELPLDDTPPQTLIAKWATDDTLLDKITEVENYCKTYIQNHIMKASDLRMQLLSRGFIE